MCNYRIIDMCKRSPVSGYGTVENEDGTKVAYLCKQHADMKKNGFLDLDRIVWTDKVVAITNTPEEEIMKTIKDLEAEVENHYGASIEQLVQEITTIIASDVRVAHKFPFHCVGKAGCGKYHATADDVARCYGVDEKTIASRHLNTRPLTTTFEGGGSREWFATKKAAFVRIGELKVANKSFSFKPAANKNGFNIFIK